MTSRNIQILLPNAMKIRLILAAFVVLIGSVPMRAVIAQEPIKFNHPELTVDLGVGLWAWPLPMDWDQDGDLDLIVACPDKPYAGTYFFENTSPEEKMPVFQPAVRIGEPLRNAQVSFIDDDPRILTPRNFDQGGCLEYTDFVGKTFSNTIDRSCQPVELGDGRARANQWKMVDFDGDGILDLIQGVGYWGDYGWDDAFNEAGDWQRGPLHGFVYVFHNNGTNEQPEYAAGYRLQAAGADIDVYGMPTPNFADFDNDGDLDLICGEFLDGFTFFNNSGTREKPAYDNGVYLTNDGLKVAMHVQMITPVAIDWDRDGDIDLICGDEDGRVAFVENTGAVAKGVPQFLQPAYFQQVADDLKFGALVTPCSVDWDQDGDEDLICGNTSGNIGFVENLDGGNPPKWAAPVLLEVDGEAIHLQAGKNGSIQGPCEAKWGYTVPVVADWDHDGLHDLVVNSIWGKVIWFKNIGNKNKPMLAAAQPVTVQWSGDPPKPAWNWWAPADNELATQWRTTPAVIDWNKDGLNDLVMLDHDGYLAFYQRQRMGDQLSLLPGQRIFQGKQFNNRHTDSTSDDLPLNGLLRLNSGTAGGSGRRKIDFIDWDHDGDFDLLVNAVNINWLENTGTADGMTTFVDRGPLGDRVLAGHTTCPTTVDWNRDGVRELIAGAEDGRFYLFGRKD